MQRITTVVTKVYTGDDDSRSRLRAIAERDADLKQHADIGYTLAHTHVLHGTDADTFVDTMTKTDEE